MRICKKFEELKKINLPYVKIMKIIILRRNGYIENVLTKTLLNNGHKLKIIDSQWFGQNLSYNKNLKLLKKILEI